MSSISSILADTLDLIGKEDAHPKGSVPTSSTTKTASAILLEEKKKSRAMLEELDFIPVPNNIRPANPDNAMFDQIAATAVEAPTYWKDASKDKQNKGKPAVIAMPAGNRKKQDKMKKGEDYKDRFNEKKAGKIHRKNRIESMARPY
jgi:hypothetical protein